MIVLPPVTELNVRRLLHELFYRERWPRGKTLARLLLEALDDAAGVTGDESARAGPRGEQFAAMVRRVARDFESHPLRDQFIQLLQDERELLDDQIPPLVEYLYSSVVNNFKGEIAELLARPVIHRYARRFTFPVALISGWKIAEPKLRSNRLVWAKGADGLLVADGDRLGIAAVIEIKSYRLNTEEMALQARKHVNRLRRGLRIDDLALAGDAYDFIVGGDGSRVPAAEASAVIDVASLCIRTPATPQTRATLSDGMMAVAELPFTKFELSKAAFAMAEWFLARLGPIVYHLPGDPRPSTVLSRWPDAPLDDAGRWGTREAFHHMAVRLERYRVRHDSSRTRRALSRTYWLYNAMGWGYENARGDRMVWGEDLSPPPGEVDGGIEAARDHFRNAHFAEARAVLAGLRAKEPDDAQLRKIRWLEGMIEYRDLRFPEAKILFPGATGQRSDIWNHRDMLMEARLAARTGLIDEATAILERTFLLGIVNPGFLVECEGVRALLCAFRGDRAGVAEASNRAKAFRSEIARQLDERRAAGRDDPEIEWQGLTMGKLDLASAAAAAGDHDDAEWWVRAMTVRMDEWIPPYVERDPLLAAIQSRVADWLAAQRS